MEPIVIEVRLAPDTEALLKSFAPRFPNGPQLPPQSPAEQTARMRIQQQPAPMPQQPAPTYAPPRPAPTYDPRNPMPQSVSQIYPQTPAAPIRNSRPAPVNPTQAAPMPSNRMTGAANMAPAAGPAPSQPVPIAPSTNPMSAGPSTAQPAAAPSNPAPIAAAPTYEQDQLARATATLADAGKMQQIQQLFRQFQIQQMDQLPKERYGEFATALRGLGVRI